MNFLTKIVAVLAVSVTLLILGFLELGKLIYNRYAH